MFQYFIRRLFIFVPTLVIISLIAFGLSKLTPGDPVLRRLESPEFEDQSSADMIRYDQEYRRTAAMLNVDKPAFYFSLSSWAYPDTLHRINYKERRDCLEKIIAQYGNWPLISSYYDQVIDFEHLLADIPDSIALDALPQMRSEASQLLIQYEDNRIQEVQKRIKSAMFSEEALLPYAEVAFNKVVSSYQEIKQKPEHWKLYIPIIYWFGFNNQYHHWISDFLVGDFGLSYNDGRPVSSKIWSAAWWTIIINLSAIFWAFLLSIPLGVYAAVRRGQTFDRVSSLVLFLLYSLPTFWIATLMVIFFTTPEYGNWTNIFPSIGLGRLGADADFWDRFWERTTHLILPIICLTYSSLAFIARQMRGGVINVIQEDYIRTARAKGLSERKVIWKHAFRNALFPLITLFALVFPSAIGGSVVIEAIFNLPGMGRLVLDAIFSQDWPIVYTVLMITAILTMVGNLLADLLYALADPRISYSNK